MKKTSVIESAIDRIVQEGDDAPPPRSRLVRGPNGLLMMPSSGQGKEITQEMVNEARDEGYLG
jgi:hypothetical protein